MTRRLIFAIVFGTAALALAGCKTETASNTKHLLPIPNKTLALMKDKGMRKEDPILVRIYKEESQLEVWKKRPADGRYALLKSYEICRWSGGLGPKKVEGDGQSPEGFYTVTPGQMNPNSAYFLSFNIGYPNAYDRSLGRSGQHLMVHGDCLSKGCYAMTDPQIAEVYALAREALNGGQRGFQVQALPFRMTAENMARRRDNENIAFWENLKEGVDHFEVTKLEPKVDVCGRKYVFDAEAKDGGQFDPNAACPSYEVQPAIAMAVAGKQRQDEQKFSELVSKGLQTAEAYIPQNGRLRRTLKDPIVTPTMIAQAKQAAPMTPIPGRAASASGGTAMAMAGSSVPMPIPSPYASAQQPKPGQSGGMFAWLSGREDANSGKPAELDTPRTPSAHGAEGTPAAGNGAITLATTQSRSVVVAPQHAVTASLAPQSQKPFYKRMFGFGGDQPKPQPAAATAPVPNPAPAPAAKPAPKPAAAAAKEPVSNPEPAPAPEQTASAPNSGPGLPPITDVDSYGLRTAPILNTGGFTR